MKPLALVALLTTSLFLHADPLPPQGFFTFREQVLPVARVTIEVIGVYTDADRRRLNSLRQQGATCTLVAHKTFRCSQPLSGEHVSLESIENMKHGNLGLNLDFAQEYTYRIIHPGDAIKEWEVSQKVLVKLPWVQHPIQYDGYRYLETSGGAKHKIIFSGGNEFMVMSENRLFRFVDEVVRESPKRWHSDAAVLLLNREKRNN